MSVCIKSLIRNLNLVVGCSVGCAYCYARNNCRRFHMTDDDNVWMGVTVTCEAEKGRIAALRQHARARHYHVTFEPLFGPIEGLDLRGVEWIVVGTETGHRRGKVDARPEWVAGIVAQARAQGVAVFMKEDLLPILGEEGMIQELPEAFKQRIWNRN